MILKVINNVSLAFTDSSASTSALVIPSGIVRICASHSAFITITTSAGSADNTGIVIGANKEVILEVANGSFINALRATSTSGRMSISCVEIGQQVAQ